MANVSSISSSDSGSLPALPFGWTLGAGLLTFLALEVAIALFHEPSPLERSVQAYVEEGADSPAVLLFGTCMVEDNVDVQVLRDRIAPGARLWDFSAEGTSPMDWMLVLQRHLPPDAPVRGVVVLYGEGDLNTFSAPWESQVMDLVSWSALPDLVGMTCDSGGCKLDLLLRKASLTYRYRSFVAQWAWARLGIGSKTWLPQLPGGLPHPERFGGPQPCRRLDTQAPAFAEPSAVENRLGDWGGGDADTSAIRNPDQRERLMAATWAWKLGVVDAEAFMRYPEVYLEHFVGLATERGWPVWVVPFPTRAPPGAPNVDSGADPIVQRVVLGAGGRHLEPGPSTELTDSRFVDDQRLDPEGRALLSAALADLLAEQLGVEAPPPR